MEFDKKSLESAEFWIVEMASDWNDLEVVFSVEGFDEGEFAEFENPVNSVASVFDGQWKTFAYNPDI